MLRFIGWRLLMMIPTLFVISIISFTIIQLPPGDFLTSYVARISARGETIDEADILALRNAYGLGEPIYIQYFKWISGVLHGDFGQSFTWRVPVANLIWDRVGLTILISFITLMFTWMIAFPIGVYSAVRQYSILDYIFTFIGFVGCGHSGLFAGADLDGGRVCPIQYERGRSVFPEPFKMHPGVGQKLSTCSNTCGFR